MKLKETKVFTLANHKGGAGKTTSADGFIYALSEMGYKILAVDADAQMNLSYSYNFRRMPQNLHNILMDIDEVIKPESQILHTDYPNIDIIIADTNMASIEMELTVRMYDRDRILAKMVQQIKNLKKYDFIVFDTNPSLGLLNYNVLMASDYLIIPVECSAYGIEGITHINDFYQRVRKYNKNLQIAGVVRCKVQTNLKATQLVLSELETEFPGIIIETIINKNESVSQAQLLKQPIGYFDKGRTRPAKQYRDMTVEVLKRAQIG